MRVRADISKKNEYWIPKHRYYELKHFCLQYPIWKKELAYIDGFAKVRIDISNLGKTEPGNPTENAFYKGEILRSKIDMVKEAAKKADESLALYILRGVTEGVSYDYLKARLDIPCSRETYYNLYRKFFRLLDLVRC